MPEIRPFRALRFDPSVVGDLAPVVSPPYDVIGEALQRTLLERHAANVVRLDLPPAESGEDPDERYRRAARTLARWRSDGTLHRDPRPSLYAYEQTYRLPGSSIERSQRGFFGRLRLEAFGPDGGVRPHERTMSAPKEDRYRLLRATAVNTSPVVGLYADGSGRTADVLATVASDPAISDVTDDDGVRHRLWVVEEGDGGGPAGELARLAGAGPITIADGHHRYETALRYRDERRSGTSPGSDEPFDFIMALVLESSSQPLAVLPTHRIVRALGEEAAAGLVARAADLFEVAPASAADLRAAFGPGGSAWDGSGLLGVWTRAGGATLRVRHADIEPLLPPGGPTVRGLDVTVLGVALERLAGIDAAAVVRGDRLAYTHDAGDALERVDAGTDGADAAFLLAPTPVEAVVNAAAEGDVMPQKSTYFYPKALTGLVINPHEW